MTISVLMFMLSFIDSSISVSMCMLSFIDSSISVFMFMNNDKEIEGSMNDNINMDT
jgi:hypothetical protein